MTCRPPEILELDAKRAHPVTVCPSLPGSGPSPSYCSFSTVAFTFSATDGGSGA